MSVTIARECHGIIDISGIHLRLVKIALPNIQKLNCMFVLDKITEIINPYQIPFFSSCDSGLSEVNEDSTIIEGLMVLYRNVDCISM